MAKRTERFQDEKTPSARHLILMFLAAVAVCAVFFSLGFVVGHNHSPSKATPVTENVTGSGNIPPTVNPPAGDSSQPSAQSTKTENVGSGPASVPPPQRPQPVPKSPVASPHARAQKTPVTSAPTPAPQSKAAAAAQKPSTPSAPAKAGSHFAVQVMASRTKVDAENLVKLLKSHGYQVYVLSPQQAQAKDNLYRVQVGPFPSRVEADRARDKLEGEGLSPFVVH
jgi:DedD protein